MRKFILGFVLVFLSAACGSKNTESKLPLETDKQKLSYLLGADNASQLLQDPNFAKYNKANILKGFEEGLKNEKAFDQNCQMSIQNLFGQNQNEFNAQYVDEASTCIGKFLGSMFKNGWMQAKSYDEFDEKYLIYGFELGLNKADTLIESAVKEMMVSSFMEKVNTRVLAEVTKQEKKFFAEVKKMEGVKELTEGIYVETIQEGNGAQPTTSSDVKAHYVLLNTVGDTLQSSLSNPSAPIFNLGQVIPGWTLSFPLLKKGGKYKLYVPQSKAYGKDSPDPATIPPYATLVFYVDFQDFGPAGTLK